MTWNPSEGEHVVIIPSDAPPARSSIYRGHVRSLGADGALVEFVMGGMTSVRLFDTSTLDETYSTPFNQWTSGYTMMSNDNPQVAEIVDAHARIDDWNVFMDHIEQARSLAESDPHEALKMASEALEILRRTYDA